MMLRRSLEITGKESSSGLLVSLVSVPFFRSRRAMSQFLSRTRGQTMTSSPSGSADWGMATVGVGVGEGVGVEVGLAAGEKVVVAGGADVLVGSATVPPRSAITT